jgi:hypothetical protein
MLNVYYFQPANTRIGLSQFNSQSACSKFTSIQKWIYDNNFALAALIKVWLHGFDSPQLIACSMSGHSYVYRVRRRLLLISLGTNQMVLAYTARVQISSSDLHNFRSCWCLEDRRCRCLPSRLSKKYRLNFSMNSAIFFNVLPRMLCRLPSSESRTSVVSRNHCCLRSSVVCQSRNASCRSYTGSHRGKHRTAYCCTTSQPIDAI